jgi:hypothetical protein
MTEYSAYCQPPALAANVIWLPTRRVKVAACNLRIPATQTMRRALERNYIELPGLADDWRKYQAPSAAMSSHLDQSRQRTPRKQGPPPQQIHWRVDSYRVDADFTGQLPAVGLTVKILPCRSAWTQGISTLKPSDPSMPPTLQQHMRRCWILPPTVRHS